MYFFSRSLRIRRFRGPSIFVWPAFRVLRIEWTREGPAPGPEGARFQSVEIKHSPFGRRVGPQEFLKLPSSKFSSMDC